MKDIVKAPCIIIRKRWVERLTAEMSKRLPPTVLTYPTIGIIGALGSNDVGDEAMLVSLIDELRNWNPRVHCLAFSYKPESTLAYVGVESVPDLRALVFNRRNLLSILLYVLDKAESVFWRIIPQRWLDSVWREGWLRRVAYALLRRYLFYRAHHQRMASTSYKKTSRTEQFLSHISSLNALIVLGGGYLNSWHVKAESHLWTMTIETAAIFGIPIFTTGLNLGPFNWYDQKRIGQALSHCVLIGIRDRLESVEALKAMGIYDPDRCYYSCDDAIDLRADTLGHRHLEYLENQPYAVVQLHRWLLDDHTLEAILSQVARVVQTSFLEHGVRLILVPMTFGAGYHGDKEVLSRLALKLGEQQMVMMLPSDLHPKQIKYVFSHAYIALVSRHHGMVFSVGSGVPVVALVFDRYYQMKFRGIAENSEGLCQLVQYDVDISHKLMEAISNVLAIGRTNSREKTN